MYSIYFKICKIWPLLWPNLIPGIMIFATLSLCYLRMFSHKFQLFWLIFFSEKISQNISTIPNYLPIKKDVVLILYKFESPLPKISLCWRCWKCEKVTDRRTTDKVISEKFTLALSSGELIKTLSFIENDTNF